MIRTRSASWARNGRGTHEYHDVMGRVDIITGTLGKALGGASGGYTSGRKEIIELLRQRSRPYLFSNTLCPSIAAASLKVLELISASTGLRDKLEANTRFFRDAMTRAGFNILPGEHPIVPIMFGDAARAARFAERMLDKGVYVIPLQLSGGAAGQGAHPHPDQRRAHPRGSGNGGRRVRRGRARIGGIAPLLSRIGDGLPVEIHSPEDCFRFSESLWNVCFMACDFRFFVVWH